MSLHMSLTRELGVLIGPLALGPSSPEGHHLSCPPAWAVGAHRPVASG